MSGEPKTTLESLANPQVAAMAAYTPGLQPTGDGWIKLNTNELPYPPSPKVVAAIQEELGSEGARLRLYPNPTSAPLRQALAEHHRVTSPQVLIGNGADDVLNLLCRAFASPQRAVGMGSPSYSLYAVLAAAQGAPLVEVAFAQGFELPAETIAATPANLFFLTSPHAPTGRAFALSSIEWIAKRFQGILVIDETYAPFAEESAIALLEQFPHLVVVRSFSKAFGLAGLRVGYAIASPAVINLLDRVRDSYNVNRLSQVGALAALQDLAYYQEVRRKVLATREAWTAHYREMGWHCYPSATNFQFVEPRNARGETGPTVAADLFQFLQDHRILVRRFPDHPLTNHFLRISLGSPTEMTKLKQTLEQWKTKT